MVKILQDKLELRSKELNKYYSKGGMNTDISYMLNALAKISKYNRNLDARNKFEISFQLAEIIISACMLGNELGINLDYFRGKITTKWK